MKFVSTRGSLKFTFEQALFCCYTKDGGMLMPEEIPQVSIEVLKIWKNLSYVDIVKQIVSMYISEEEINRQEQHVILEKAFKKFDTSNVVEMRHLKDGLNILELWHGDTLAFKDLAMTCTIQFMNYFLSKQKRHFTSVVVTSGDTGSSAMYASRNIPNIDVLVFYPHNRISQLQELMMTTLEANNLHVYAVDGSCDDIDVTATRVLTDSDFVSKYNVGTMNSMNWCRILIQIAHHVYGYLQTTKSVGNPVEIIVPCGGCGNIAALLLARSMGVPILPVGVCNKNDSFYQMILTNKRLLRNVEVSKAPAMDISLAQNVERIIWLFADKDGGFVKKLMEDFIKTKISKLPENIYEKLQNVIKSSVASDDVIVDTIKRCWKENDYFLCPHTATAVAHYYGCTEGYRKRDENVPTLCIATASAAKFAEVLLEAGLPECKSDKIEVLREKENRAKYLAKTDNWEQTMRDKVVELST